MGVNTCGKHTIAMPDSVSCLGIFDVCLLLISTSRFVLGTTHNLHPFFKLGSHHAQSHYSIVSDKYKASTRAECCISKNVDSNCEWRMRGKTMSGSVLFTFSYFPPCPALDSLLTSLRLLPMFGSGSFSRYLTSHSIKVVENGKPNVPLRGQSPLLRPFGRRSREIQKKHHR